MPLFRLDPEVAVQLVERFSRFRADRELIARRIESYRRDFLEATARLGRGSAYRELKERYLENAPDLRNIIFDPDRRETLWELRDIGIVLDRSVASLSRSLEAMRNSPKWRERLLSVRSAAHDFAFHRGIFDVFIDYYEDSYIRRFADPRGGKARSADETAQILAFWEYLHEHPELTEDEALATVSLSEGQAAEAARALLEEERPTFAQMLRRIVRRMFTLHVGSLFVLFYAAYYEASARWPWLVWGAPAVCAALFVLSLWLLRNEKYWGFEPASLGAGVIVFMMLWTGGNVLGLSLGADRASLWPKRPDLTRREAVSEQARMSDGERRWNKLFGEVRK